MLRKFYKMNLEYEGTEFIGWQRQSKQSNGTSVQEIVENILSKILNEEINISAAGRTDSGVHAIQQVISFSSCHKELNLQKFLRSFEFFIRPYKIIATDIKEVDESFNARFSAKSRTYLYKILNRNSPSIFLKNKVWHFYYKKLDIHQMIKASKLLIGKHDFSSFRSKKCQSKSPNKTIDSINIFHENTNDDIICIEIKAKSFLHNQVRIIVEVLSQIGIKKYDVDYIIFLLNIKNRDYINNMAPPHGLYLKNIEY